MMTLRSELRSDPGRRAAQPLREHADAMVTLITADRELENPRAFAARAMHDLRRAIRLAPLLFALQLRSRRRASLLGWLWLILPTLATMLIGLALQRQHGLPLPRTQIPYAAFATIGIAVWQCAVEALNLPLRQLSAHRFAITRLHMPVEAPLAAGLIELALNAAIRVGLLLLLLPLLGVSPGATIAALPLALAGLIALCLAIGIFAAPLGLLVEDIGRGLVILAGLWMMATPVLYPIPDALSRWNPASTLVEVARASLTGGEWLNAALPVALASLTLLIASWLWLRLARPYLIERTA
jgi:lipopolysaccharide transport system permease protein